MLFQGAFSKTCLSCQIKWLSKWRSTASQWNYCTSQLFRIRVYWVAPAPFLIEMQHRPGSLPLTHLSRRLFNPLCSLGFFVGHSRPSASSNRWSYCSTGWILYQTQILPIAVVLNLYCATESSRKLSGNTNVYVPLQKFKHRNFKGFFEFILKILKFNRNWEQLCIYYHSLVPRPCMGITESGILSHLARWISQKHVHQLVEYFLREKNIFREHVSQVALFCWFVRHTYPHI